jgi:hypothetical protein
VVVCKLVVNLEQLTFRSMKLFRKRHASLSVLKKPDTQAAGNGSGWLVPEKALAETAPRNPRRLLAVCLTWSSGFRARASTPRFEFEGLRHAGLLVTKPHESYHRRLSC